MAIEGIFYVHAHVSNLVRAKRFYGETSGWRLETDEPVVAGFWWFGTGYFVAIQDERAANDRRFAGGQCDPGASAISASPTPTATCGSTDSHAPEC